MKVPARLSRWPTALAHNSLWSDTRFPRCFFLRRPSGLLLPPVIFHSEEFPSRCFSEDDPMGCLCFCHALRPANIPGGAGDALARVNSIGVLSCVPMAFFNADLRGARECFSKGSHGDTRAYQVLFPRQIPEARLALSFADSTGCVCSC